MRPIILPRGCVGIDWNDHIKRRQCLFRSMRSSRLLPSSRVRVELIRRIGCCVVFKTVQRRLVVARYHSRHPDSCPTLTPEHRHRHCILTHRHHNWKHQYRPHVVFADESMVNFYNSDCPDNPLAFQQHEENLGHGHCICRNWPWTH